MLSRGYSQDSQMYTARSTLGRWDVLFAAANIFILALLHILQVGYW